MIAFLPFRIYRPGELHQQANEVHFRASRSGTAKVFTRLELAP
jgi:hypothetical protein